MEQCKNPWNKECKNDNIQVYIIVKGERVPICRHCWDKLANQDVEW